MKNNKINKNLHLKGKGPAVKRIKIRVRLKVEAVEVWGVHVLAAGVEGAPCWKLREAPRAAADLRGSAGDERGHGRTGVQVSQSRGGGSPTHQQAHGPHRPRITAVAMTKTVGHPVRRRDGRTPQGAPHSIHLALFS